MAHYFLFLSNILALLKLERANFEILIKKKKKKRTTKQQKNNNNFFLIKECPKLLCGLDIGYRRRQTIPMWNSLGKKEFFRASCMSDVCGIEHYVMTW